mmetsp:Transcript_96546/g.311341  ORF Transcript_96546/g.311341 Transcript_96546/m.311341 type:complete len:123 (-) Transcript_96546:246-614(-)
MMLLEVCPTAHMSERRGMSRSLPTAPSSVCLGQTTPPKSAARRSSASDQVPRDFQALVAGYSKAFSAGFGQQQGTRKERAIDLDVGVSKELVFDAPQSKQYILYGVRGARWTSLLPEDESEA